MITKPTKWWRLSAVAFGIASLCLVAVAAQVSPPNAGNSTSAERKEISLPAATLEKYTGSFKFLESAVMTITRDGNHLFTQLTGQPAVEVFPESTTEFFLKVVDAQISFVLDETGLATALVLHQNGANITLPRIDKASAEKITKQTTDKVQNQTPTPGSEAALRGLITGLASGNPDYSSMSPEMQQATRDQLKQLHAGTSGLGPINTIKFRSVDIQGWDVYYVSHEKGNSEWKIKLADGVIIGAWVNN